MSGIKALGVLLVAIVITLVTAALVPSPEPLIAKLFESLAEALRQAGVFDEDFDTPLTIASIALIVGSIIATFVKAVNAR